MKTVLLAREGCLLVTALQRKYITYIMANAIDEDFGADETQELFAKIKDMYRAGIALPTPHEFALDPTISADAQDILKTAKPYKSEARIKECLGMLDEYRKIRAISNSVNYIVNAFKRSGKQGVDSDDLITSMETAIKSVRVRNINDKRTLDFGFNANNDHAIKLLNERLSSDPETTELIRSGFNNFDERSLGFSRKHVLLLGASHSSGKTSLAVQMSKNFYRQGYSVAFIELEMSDGEAYDRLGASLTGIDSLKLRDKKLTPKEKKLLERRHKGFQQYGITHRCRYTLDDMSSMTAGQIDMLIGHSGYDVIMVDYLGLVSPDKGQAGKPIHEMKADITRQFKQIAKARNCLVVLLVQLNEEMRVKYSKAVEDHVDWFWSWILNDEARALNCAKIHQPKARHAEEYPFLLNFDLSTSVWKDWVGDDPFQAMEKRKRKTFRRGKQIDGYEPAMLEEM